VTELVVSGAEDSAVSTGSWAPDGSFAYFRSPKTQSAESGPKWMLLPPPGSSDVQSSAGPGRHLDGIGTDAMPDLQISPDGKAVAYSAGEEGTEVYVAAFPGPGAKTQISTRGGARPKWSRDGKELFYVEGQWFETTPRLMSVNMTTVPPGRPQVVATLPNRFFDVTPDPNRFLVRRPPEGQDRGGTIIVITNWFEDLLRQVPVKK